MEYKNISFDNNIYLQYLWDNITFEMFVKFLIVYFCIIWIAIIVWVIRDISNRTDSFVLQLISILLVLLLTPLWVFLYILIRPWKTLFERYYDEIEENLDMFSDIIENKVKWSSEKINCYKCKSPLSPDFKFCPKCKVDLKKECSSCEKQVYLWWKVCPYCWEETKKENKKHHNDKKDNK